MSTLPTMSTLPVTDIDSPPTKTFSLTESPEPDVYQNEPPLSVLLQRIHNTLADTLKSLLESQNRNRVEEGKGQKPGENALDATIRLVDRNILNLETWQQDLSIKQKESYTSALEVLDAFETREPDPRKKFWLRRELTSIYRKVLSIWKRREAILPNSGGVSSAIEQTAVEISASIEQLASAAGWIVQTVTNSTIHDSSGEIPPQLITVLSFDGGGVRSYSSLLILKAIMDEINAARLRRNKELSYELRPRDIFKYIVGSSSGGLIAIMLGRLGMTVEECLGTFKEYSEAVFGSTILKRARSIISTIGITKYASSELHAAVQLVVRKYESNQPGDKWSSNIFSDPNDSCRTVVVANEIGKDFDRLHLFRTYHASRPFRGMENYERVSPTGKEHKAGSTNTIMADDYSIWQVALATSAAPIHFPPIHIGEKTYYDAAIGCKNPGFEAYLEAYTNSRKEDRVALLSLGSGKFDKLERKSPMLLPHWHFISILNKSLSMLTDSERASEQLEALSKGDKLDYFRFNISMKRWIRLDEWEVKTMRSKDEKSYVTAELLESLTTKYLSQEEVARELRKCAEFFAAGVIVEKA